MSERRRARLLVALMVAAVTAVTSAEEAASRPRPGRDAASLDVFSLVDGRVQAPAGAPRGALPIGSLAKPFVARAWALAHPGLEPPVVRCTPASACWRASGHGSLGLARAVAVSCNAYFHSLAAATPEALLRSTLLDAGLLPPDPLSAEQAIGLPGPSGLVAAEPARLLRAYVALLREPWPGGEPVRRQLVAGLRDSSRDGTAAGLAGLGLHAKTGTVPALDGRPLATSGWTIAVDEAGRGFLGLLTPGTGREAARALGSRLRGSSARTAAPAFRTPSEGSGPAARSAPALVRVSLFSALAPKQVRARNAGTAPVSTSRGYAGPGASLELRAGDRLATGDWELTLPASGLRRGLRGALRVDGGPRDVLRVRAELAPLEYVAGVIAAELSGTDPEARLALGAAALRFLAEGPRHGDADVCDLTHCAFFVGRGPRAAWPTPGRAVLIGAPFDGGAGPPIGEPAWRDMLEAARHPGPARWTSHCGGEPLSPHAVWGGGDRRAWRCPHHGPSDRAEWTRRWTRADVDRALGGRVDALEVGEDDGSWRLVGRREGAAFRLSWDEAHARLAGVLGWDALPSPADRVVREGDGYRASGRGLGHRVGLCLGAPAGAVVRLLD